MDSIIYQRLPHVDTIVNPELAVLLADVVNNFINTGNYTIFTSTLPQENIELSLHMMCEKRPVLFIDRSIETFHYLIYENEVIRRRDGSRKIRIYRPDGKKLSDREIIDWLVEKNFSKVRASPTIDLDNERYMRRSVW